MTLAWSRHQYVEFVFDQKIATWLLCHRHALEFFGGAPERIVPDNLKAAVVRACFDDPLLQQTYRECAEHYGFLTLAPALQVQVLRRVGWPRRSTRARSSKAACIS